MDLMGKIALVTGGSRGIGRAIADALHAAGAGVAILDRDAERAPITAREIGDDVCAMIADVTNPDQVASALATVEETCGPIDILVNNAGVTKDGLLARMSSDDWDAVLDVNLKGAFLLTKAVARGMMKRRWGRIINISSVVGLMGNAGQANYAASKAGLIGFTKSVARELASRNVLVNAIAPGFIETDMTAALTEAQRDTLRAQIPLGRLGQGMDIARAVVFLASDHADYITGQVLVVDGGMVM
ncbi:MAG: 3-oxoacyl-[acyl-carrier-protein] reductase [Gemmatimonadota bacterium]|nr:3-oxoacyl-[acyl-carrier-protein] reductase [Gemmatimonadota bacterium]MDH5197156.1 3-oxoacyl-[acyl-carrier-protein] reductase [Gemmatimonadota bacterium]